MTTNIKNIDTLINTLENFNGNFNYTPTELIDKIIKDSAWSISKQLLKVAASTIKNPTLSPQELKQIAEILKWANE